MSGEGREVFCRGRRDKPCPPSVNLRWSQKRWLGFPRMLTVHEPGLGEIPQPDVELRLCVNEVSGTSLKGWPHGSPGCCPAPYPSCEVNKRAGGCKKGQKHPATGQHPTVGQHLVMEQHPVVGQHPVVEEQSTMGKH